MTRATIALCVWLTGAALQAGCAEVKGQGDASGAAGGGAGTGASAYDGSAGLGGGSLKDALGAPATGFTMSKFGGYKLGARLASDAESGPGSGPKICNTITGVVRDFKGALAAPGGMLERGGHPDFEVFEGRVVTPGLVAADLGPDKKPVYVPKCQKGTPISDACPFGAMTTSVENFRQWYRSDGEGVNQAFLVYLQLVPGDNGVPTFWSEHFFPMDGQGWGDNGVGFDDMGHNNVRHNFGFTTEVHTTFKYMGGERFDFDGDDDVWVFVNGKLAVDLGGLHLPEKGAIDLDARAAALGITKGMVYPMDLFHAERHSIDSNFHLEMNFMFEDCGYVVP